MGHSIQANREPPEPNQECDHTSLETERILENLLKSQDQLLSKSSNFALRFVGGNTSGDDGGRRRRIAMPHSLSVYREYGTEDGVEKHLVAR